MMNSVELLNKPSNQSHVATVSTLTIRRTSQFNFALKRAFDVMLAALSLICLLPLLIASMIAIMVESSGSPIFMQRRVGQNGKVFNIFKLRTMRIGSDELDYKTREKDPRLTGVGIWLRRLNIDELPQLINVLIGDMSVIGPRPLSEAETSIIVSDGFAQDTPGLVPTMKPGLVGLEQINRTRNLTYSERFKFNFAYENEWSIMTDTNILLGSISQCSPVCIAVILGAAALSFVVAQIH